MEGWRDHDGREKGEDMEVGEIVGGNEGGVGGERGCVKRREV